jgi:HPt (histidine-containing phosphotransfer) domain-containing protein
MSNTDGSKDTDQIFMDELFQEFKETVATQLKEMSLLYQENNFTRIKEIAHDIKGTSGIFELDQGSEIADKLVQAAKDKNAEETKELLEELNDYMRKNKIIS